MGHFNCSHLWPQRRRLFFNGPEAGSHTRAVIEECKNRDIHIQLCHSTSGVELYDFSIAFETLQPATAVDVQKQAPLLMCSEAGCVGILFIASLLLLGILSWSTPRIKAFAIFRSPLAPCKSPCFARTFLNWSLLKSSSLNCVKSMAKNIEFDSFHFPPFISSISRITSGFGQDAVELSDSQGTAACCSPESFPRAPRWSFPASLHEKCIAMGKKTKGLPWTAHSDQWKGRRGLKQHEWGCFWIILDTAFTGWNASVFGYCRSCHVRLARCPCRLLQEWELMQQTASELLWSWTTVPFSIF